MIGIVYVSEYISLVSDASVCSESLAMSSREQALSPVPGSRALAPTSTATAARQEERAVGGRSLGAKETVTSPGRQALSMHSSKDS